MGMGVPQSPASPGSWWCWPPTSCAFVTHMEPWDWGDAVELIETDPESY